MKQLKILIINQYYPPDTSATAEYLQKVVKVLSERHHFVKVLAGRPSYAPIETHPWYFHRREVNNKVVIERIGSTAYSRFRMIGRILNYFSYLFLAFLRALTIKADIIIAMTDPPITGVIGALVALLKRSIFLYSIQDLHPDMALASGMVKKGFLVNLWEKIHRWSLHQAQTIFVIGNDMRQRVIDKGVDSKNIQVIRHGAPERYRHISQNNPVIQNIRGDFSFVVIHAGNIGFSGAWETILKSAKLLENDKIGFVFIGEGADKSRIQTIAAQCKNIRFLPYYLSEDLPYVLSAADIHIITIKKGLDGLVVPSKLYPILSAGRPILAVAPKNSDLARIVTSFNCGINVDPENPAAIVTTIKDLRNDSVRLKEMSISAAAAANEYNQIKQLHLFTDLIEKSLQITSDEGRIKILRIISRLNIGGPAIHVQVLTKELNHDKFDSMLIIGTVSPNEGDMRYIFDSIDSKIVYVPELGREINFAKDIQALIAIFKILLREKPHIVETHMAKAGFSGRLAVFFYNMIYRQKIICMHTFHGHVFDGYFSKSKSFVFIYLERMIAKYTDIIISLSKTQKHEFAEEYRIAPAKKIRTIELGFNLKPFLGSRLLRGKFRRKLKIDDASILVGIVGRLVSIKNHKMFFEAAKIFIQQNPNLSIVFVIVGDGALRGDLETYCRSHDLSDHVKFCGWIKDIESVYADLDVLALTSINEGTPVSIIEAMASSVPVIATNAGGVMDMLGPAMKKTSDNGFKICERGVLCRKNDAIGFSKGLKWLIDNKTSAKGEMVNSARAFVKERYTYKRLIADMEKLYTGLVQ